MTEEERRAGERIRSAAIHLFAERGFAATTVRQIASAAGVSPGLVLHYFDSKDGLRAACDRYVFDEISERKHSAAAQGLGVDAVSILRSTAEGPPLLRYLARALADRSPGMTALVDQMIEDAVEYMAVMTGNGTLKPTERGRERAVVMAIWSLGALVLHEHVERHLHVDLLGDPFAPGAPAYAMTAMEILGEGILSPEIVEVYRSALIEKFGDGRSDPDGTGGDIAGGAAGGPGDEGESRGREQGGE